MEQNKSPSSEPWWWEFSESDSVWVIEREVPIIASNIMGPTENGKMDLDAHKVMFPCAITFTFFFIEKSNIQFLAQTFFVVKSHKRKNIRKTNWVECSMTAGCVTKRQYCVYSLFCFNFLFQVPEEDIVSVTDMLQHQRKEPATSWFLKSILSRVFLAQYDPPHSSSIRKGA